MSEIIEVKMFLYEYCANKVTIHLGYYISILFVLASAFRIQEFKQLICKNKKYQKVLVLGVIIGSFWVLGRTLFWMAMMDRIDLANFSGSVDQYAIGKLIRIAKDDLMGLALEFKSLPKLVGYLARNSLQYLLGITGFTLIINYMFSKYNEKRG